MAAGSLDTMVRVWNVTTGQQVERLKGHKDSVYRWVLLAGWYSSVVSLSLPTANAWSLGLLIALYVFGISQQRSGP